MSNDPIPEPRVKEALSECFVRAIAYEAGYSTTGYLDDYDSLDLTILSREETRPRIDIQLKATVNLDDTLEEMSFPCPIKNYNDLRAKAICPRYLIVLKLPDNPEIKRLETQSDALVIRHCAYWASLRGMGETTNTKTVSVKLLKKNRLTPESLKSLMDAARGGGSVAS